MVNELSPFETTDPNPKDVLKVIGAIILVGFSLIAVSIAVVAVI